MSQGRDEGTSESGLVSLLVGVGVGVVLGGVTALLLAPQSGSETRTQLRETADDTLLRLRESMDQLRTRLDDLASGAREALARRDVPGPQGDVAGDTDDTAALP